MQKPKKLELTPEAWDRLVDFYKTSKKIPEPPPELVQKRMAELRDFGLEDIPKYEGSASAMRQYAMATVSRDVQMALGDNELEDLHFATADKPMLAKSEDLHKKFGMKVVNAVEVLCKDIADPVLRERVRRALEK